MGWLLKQASFTLGWLLCGPVIPAIAIPNGVTPPSSPRTPLTNAKPPRLEGTGPQKVEQELKAANQTSEPASRQTQALKSNTQFSTRAADLSIQPLSITESLSTSTELETPNLAEDSGSKGAVSLSPLERPMTRLFGFETATPLKQGELVIHGGLTSFNNPNSPQVLFGGGSDRTNRSNDVQAGLDYGVTDTVQLSLGVAGKDDTVFSNLIANQTSLQFLYSAIPVQAKWQVYKQDRLSAAAVVGAEFPGQFLVVAPNDALLPNIENLSDNSSARKIVFSSDPRGLGPGTTGFVAEDDSIVFSVGAPVSYQLTDQLRLHFNPQLSFFPSSIPVVGTQGNMTPLTQGNLGFDGDRLNYYGTLFGLGLGFDYTFSSFLQFAADITPVVAGRNSAGSGGDSSLFVTRPVWNAGLRIGPNSRTGLSLYATNRFGPLTASPSNLLAQAGGDIGFGIDFTYLPDLTGSYEINIRDTYPKAHAFLSPLSGFPSATLPINSVIYQLGYGSRDQVTANIRIGILDDLELALNRSSLDTPEVPVETSLFGRLSLLPDDGRTNLTAALGAGAIYTETRNISQNAGFSVYADLPVTLQVADSKLSFSATPKILIPQFVNVDPIFGITLGATWNITEQTQLIGQYTPILAGDNQIQRIRSPSQELGLQGSTGLYRIGIRQLFPAGNSLYAVDAYFGNSAGDYGLQGISTLADGGTQVGIRFNILNGVPVTNSKTASY